MRVTMMTDSVPSVESLSIMVQLSSSLLSVLTTFYILQEIFCICFTESNKSTLTSDTMNDVCISLNTFYSGIW